MPKLRLLHLSDIHLTSTLRTYKLEAGISIASKRIITALAHFVFKRQKEIDAIIVTGDIADFGNREDLNRAVNFLGLPSNPSTKTPWDNGIQADLNFFTKPIIVVPGNHDRLFSTTILGSNVQIKYGLAIQGSSLFDTYFKPYWDKGIGGVKSIFLPVNNDPVLAIIAADFSLLTPEDRTHEKFGQIGQGKVYEETLLKLIKETEFVKTEHPKCGIIWMLHFAPIFEKYYKLKEQVQLIDSENLITKATSLGIRHIFCGHTHVFKEYPPSEDNNDINIYCAGTSACEMNKVDTAIHFRDIEIEDGKVEIKSIDFRWDTYKTIFKE